MKRLGRRVGSFAVLLATSAAAQPSSSTRFARPPPVAPQPSPAERASSLEGHLALSVAERLLGSDDAEDRVRAVERLVASEQREGIDRLVRALTDGSNTLRDPRTRLTAIRALFPYASREPVRQAMEKALSTDPGSVPLVSL